MQPAMQLARYCSSEQVGFSLDVRGRSGLLSAASAFAIASRSGSEYTTSTLERTRFRVNGERLPRHLRRLKTVRSGPRAPRTSYPLLI